MPRLTYEMREARIIAWLKEEGEAVKPGDDLLEVETDKATVTVQAEVAGALQRILFQAGEVAPIGAVLALVGTADETAESVTISASGTSSPPAAGQQAVSEKPSNAMTEWPSGQEPGKRVVASPIAKRLAQQYGLDLSTLRGTGPGGRIVEADIEGELARRQPATSPEFVDFELTRLQKVSGERLAQCQRDVPQFALEVQVDMGRAADLRARSDRDCGYRPSFTSIIGRAVALALVDQPELNSAFVEGKRRQFSAIDLGFALALPAGLIVPVVRQANSLHLKELDSRLRELTARAGAGELRAEDWRDGTFTISNLGMYGVDAFQSIINPPQAAILSVGRVRETVCAREGMICIKPTVTLRLTLDHRILDGVAGARFLALVRTLVENADTLT